MAADTKLTKETFERLTAELDDLKTRGRIEIAKLIEAARALGDLSENGDYHAAKDDQGKMEARIRQLEATLEDAQITEARQVSLRFEGDAEVEHYIIGSIEESREGFTVISPTSKLGEALRDAQPGQKVNYESPTGAQLTVEIVSVEG
jgi:transcription elongation factor GreA